MSVQHCRNLERNEQQIYLILGKLSTYEAEPHQFCSQDLDRGKGRGHLGGAGNLEYQN